MLFGIFSLFFFLLLSLRVIFYLFIYDFHRSIFRFFFLSVFKMFFFLNVYLFPFTFWLHLKSFRNWIFEVILALWRLQRIYVVCLGVFVEYLMPFESPRVAPNIFKKDQFNCHSPSLIKEKKMTRRYNYEVRKSRTENQERSAEWKDEWKLRQHRSNAIHWWPPPYWPHHSSRFLVTQLFIHWIFCFCSFSAYLVSFSQILFILSFYFFLFCNFASALPFFLFTPFFLKFIYEHYSIKK